eukprot:8835486-Pyramimonas_sp.AAC.1
MAPGARLWSRCASCQTCEYNSVLTRNLCICGHCGEEVMLFRPKSTTGPKVQFDLQNEEEESALVHPKGILRA